MAIATYLGHADEQNITNGANAVACGAVVKVDAAGSKAGIVSSLQGIAANAVGAVKIRGRFIVPAKSSAVIAAGDQLIFSVSNDYASNKTADAGASSFSLGRAITAKANGGTTVEVDLNETGVNNLS